MNLADKIYKNYHENNVLKALMNLADKIYKTTMKITYLKS